MYALQNSALYNLGILKRYKQVDIIIPCKAYTYDKNGNQLTETDVKSDATTTTTFRYDADNRLVYAQGKKVDTIEYTQENGYNGFGQRILKKETIDGIVDTTGYFYDGTQVLYTTDIMILQTLSS